MKRYLLFSAVLLLLDPLFCASPSSKHKRPAHTSAVEVKAALESVRSKVEVKSSAGADWKTAKERMPLTTDDAIRTGRKSTARVRLPDGTKILLLQNSQAEMENLSSVQRAIKLVRGRLRAVVKRLKDGNSFQIKTPVGVASVRGTEFEVEFKEDGGEMAVDVLSGQVGVSRLGELAGEVLVNPGESLKFGAEGELGSPLKTGAAPMERQDVGIEVMDSRVKDSVVAQAAEEMRIADYQTAKSLIDVDGSRVRVEQYIMRPAANQFKLVSLNERPSRFDYFTYTGTFKSALPEDLSSALKEVNGKVGDAPSNYLTDYAMLMSNTKDSITDTGAGGHLVKVVVSGEGSQRQYTLINDEGLSTETRRTVDAATAQLDGSYKIYNPLKDSFQLVSAAHLDEALKISVLDSGTYRNLAGTDTVWKTRFNTTNFGINGLSKSSWAPKNGVTNTLAVDLDATFTNPPITVISENPSGDAALHNKLSLYYSNGSKLEYDNYIIDDKGKVGSTDDFAGLSTSADYQNQLLNWNYQQKVKATEMSDEINLVIDPRIGTISGLIQ